MNHNHGGGNATMSGEACTVSMLWNWNTRNTCVLAEGWHVKGGGMFAATCIGVAFMAIVYESLQHWRREYDHLVDSQLARRQTPGGGVAPWAVPRATPLQQFVRAILHVACVGVGYLLMLILMSFNGYIFVSVLIGVGLGKYFCDWKRGKIVPFPASRSQTPTSSWPDTPIEDAKRSA